MTIENAERSHSVRESYHSKPWMWAIYRCLTMFCGTLIGLFSIWCGYKLILMGATGKFSISAEGNDIKVFFTSVSPGLGLAIIGCVVAVVSYMIQPKNWGTSPAEIIKASKQRME